MPIATCYRWGHSGHDRGLSPHLACLVGLSLLPTLLLHRPSQAQSQLRPSTPLDTTVRLPNDGWLLVGTFTAPRNPVADLPAVILLNRAAGDRHAYDSTAALLARHGIASLRLDLRGHGESTNQGRFVPGAPGMDTLLRGTATDISTGLQWLARQPHVDSSRLGVVGASYSGEFAMRSAQSGPKAHLYAFLSPGSLSSESIAWLDQRATRWLFVASRRERTQATQDVIADVLGNARWADIWLWEPQAHATQLLEAVPELAALLALWLAAHLSAL